MQKPLSLILGVGLIFGGNVLSAKPKAGASASLTAEGETLKAEYAKTLADLQAELAKIGGAKGMIDHAKGKWIGGAEKGIAAAKAALQNATTPEQKAAAE